MDPDTSLLKRVGILPVNLGGQSKSVWRGKFYSISLKKLEVKCQYWGSVTRRNRAKLHKGSCSTTGIFWILKGQSVLPVKVFGKRVGWGYHRYTWSFFEKREQSVIVTESAVNGCKTSKIDLWNCMKMWNMHTKGCSGWRPVAPQSSNEAPGCCQNLAAVPWQ